MGGLAGVVLGFDGERRGRAGVDGALWVCVRAVIAWRGRARRSAGAEEGLEPEAEHVEGGQAGGEEADDPEQLAERVSRQVKVW